ncbi:hypothetical protein BJX68DRAFT_237265 [Aspergillus pseudodeflectus]|uniref:Uncharacterized protein n=1 Tax=Aspergillus pseudodeflectus TaxID=176178 RepID=A0ABR4KCM4_9EURO
MFLSCFIISTHSIHSHFLNDSMSFTWPSWSLTIPSTPVCMREKTSRGVSLHVVRMGITPRSPGSLLSFTSPRYDWT